MRWDAVYESCGSSARSSRWMRGKFEKNNNKTKTIRGGRLMTVTFIILLTFLHVLEVVKQLNLQQLHYDMNNNTSSLFSDMQLDRRRWSFRLFTSSASKKTPGTCLRAVGAHGKTIIYFFPPSTVEKLVQLPARPRGSGWTAHSLAGRLGGRLLKGFVTAFFAARLQKPWAMPKGSSSDPCGKEWRRCQIIMLKTFYGKKICWLHCSLLKKKSETDSEKKRAFWRRENCSSAETFLTAQDCFLTTGHIYLNEGRSVGQEDKTHKYRSRSAV